MTPQERTELKRLVDAARRVRAKREEALDRAQARERPFKGQQHGTVTSYNYYKCRCGECTEAHRVYMRKRRGVAA